MSDSNCKVLLVDANPQERKELSSMLGLEGYTVVAAASANKAVEIAAEDHYDVVIVDITAAGAEATEAHQRVQEISPNSAIIVMTEFASVEMVAPALEREASYVLTKPIKIEHLREVIQSIVEPDHIPLEDTPAIDRGPMGILIVDDSEEIRRLLKKCLKPLDNVQVYTAGSAIQAVQHLPMQGAQNGQPQIDLVLMDISMPEMSGTEMCRKMKADDASRDIPIIMVTAHEDQAHLLEAFEAGAMDYITKPMNVVELQARVRSALELKRQVDDRKEAYAQLRRTHLKLRDAMTNVKVLSGLLPICSSCKMIRNDAGYWNRIEAYIMQNSEATFTHGICPSCVKNLYPKQAERIMARLEQQQKETGAA